MSSPKLLRILQAVADRASIIDRGAGFFTDVGNDVRLDAREPSDSDLPCCLVYLGEGALGPINNKRQVADLAVSVVGYSKRTDDHSERVGCRILADIQTAIEDEAVDDNLAQLLRGHAPVLTATSFELFLPDSGVDAIAGRVSYSIPHVRIAGDPELA